MVKRIEQDIQMARIAGLPAVRKLLSEYYFEQFIDTEYMQEQPEYRIIDKFQPFLQRFHRLIEQNFQNHKFSVEEMAGYLHMSCRSLQLKLKSLINQGPKEYLVQFRLNSAAQLLIGTNLTVGEIQEQSGFNNASHFSYSFKRYFGISAREYRAQNLDMLEKA